jgi:hypothetical protein
MSRSFETGKPYLIKELFQHLPADIRSEDQRSVAEHVVDSMEEAVGFEFAWHDTRSISQKARGLPLILANSTQIRFRCSQRRRCGTKYTSQHQYSRTRNTRGPRQRFDCGGEIAVYFPTVGQRFDIALEFRHQEHPGRRQFGVPPKVRRWIRENPRSSPLQQREDLDRALQKGEIEGVDPKIFLTSAQIHYWWRKGFARTTYISDDPWINCENILKQHPAVIVCVCD